MSLYKHVMVDLETLGRRAGCAVLSIGACAFNESDIGPGLYLIVNRESCKLAGLHEDEETIAWWTKQEDQAAVVVKQATDGGEHLHNALEQFSAFIHSLGKGIRVWGNGSDFDNAILTACYAAAGQKQPWEFWHSRCYRTIKGLDGTKPEKRSGTYHNAFDDAVTQTRHLQQIIKRRGWPLA